MRSIVSCSLVLTLAVVACAGTSSDTTSAPPSPLIGTWGGEHAGLVATSTGGTMEYDCAAGRIVGPLLAGSDGRFVASGTHTPGHGGPARIDEVLLSRPARYTGRVDGDVLELSVVMTDSNAVVGTFQLTRGRSPHVFKCL